MGDRVAVLRKGLLQQVDSPQDLYEHPGQPVRRRLHRLASDEHGRSEPRRWRPAPRRPAGRSGAALDPEVAAGAGRRCGTTWARRSPSVSAPRTSRSDGRATRDSPAGSPVALEGAPHRSPRLGDRRALRGAGIAGADRGHQGARASMPAPTSSRRPSSLPGRNSSPASARAAGSGRATRRGRRRHQPGFTSSTSVERAHHSHLSSGSPPAPATRPSSTSRGRTR